MIHDLQQFLATTASGPITDTRELAWLLALAWPELAAEDDEFDGRMLFGRMERAFWQPPSLTFTIEILGSRYVGLTKVTEQEWTVDISKGAAICTKTRLRHEELVPPRLDIGSIADEIAFVIVSGKEDNWLRRYMDGRVRVLLTENLPVSPLVKETLDARRRRLKAVLRALTKRLTEHGWRACKSDVFEKIKS